VLLPRIVNTEQPPPLNGTWPNFFEKSVEIDPESTTGLTAEATRCLDIACDALAKQMSEDFDAEILDQDRVEMLIGGGSGMVVVRPPCYATL
jgi:hypothetical protein